MSETKADVQVSKPFIGNKLYDILKFVAQIFLPALGSFYFALAGIWGLPNANQVVGTIVVVDTFLGALLGLSSISYNKSDAKFDGDMNVERMADGKLNATLSLNKDAGDVVNKDEVLFKVKPVVEEFQNENLSE